MEGHVMDLRDWEKWRERENFGWNISHRRRIYLNENKQQTNK